MPSALELCQENVVHLLQAEPFFTPLPIMHERLKDLRTQLLAALRSKTGILVLVGTPSGKNITPGAPFVTLETKLTVSVMENVAFNQGARGTKIGANAAGEQVAAHLHNKLWTHGKALPCLSINTVERDGLVHCRVDFQTTVQLTKE
jgi:hypothetical protein